MFQVSTLRGDGGQTLPPPPYNLYPSCCWLFQGDEYQGWADTTPISSWTDLSLRRHDLFQTLAARQPLVDQTNLLNGHTGIAFDGSNDSMQAGDRLIFGNELTIFYVINNATDAIRGLWDLGYQSNYGHSLVQRSEDSGCIDWYYGNPRIDLGLVAGPNLLCFQAYSWETGDFLSYWLNGTHISSVQNGAVVGGISYGDLDQGGSLPRIGVFDSLDSGSNYQGIMYELAWFDEKLAEPDRAAIETYLLGKYGL